MAELFLQRLLLQVLLNRAATLLAARAFRLPSPLVRCSLALAATNLTTGDVEGCQLPSGATGTIYHAKPIIIQGSWIAAKNGGPNVLNQFKAFGAQMKAQLGYWMRERRDNATGL